MANLPTLPNIGDYQVGVDRVLIFIEPFIPKTQPPKAIHITPKMRKQWQDEFEMEMHEHRLKYGTLRKAVVLSVPVDMDKTKFKFDVNSIVFVPDETNSYDLINLDRTPLYLVGPRDVRGVVSSLTEEEVTKWNEKQKVYIDTVVYPELDSPTPLPARSSKGISEGGIITDLSN